MERFDLVPACQIPSRSTISPIHMHTASKQPGAMQNRTEAGGGREEGREVEGGSGGREEERFPCACSSERGKKKSANVRINK